MSASGHDDDDADIDDDDDDDMDNVPLSVRFETMQAQSFMPAGDIATGDIIAGDVAGMREVDLLPPHTEPVPYLQLELQTFAVVGGMLPDEPSIVGLGRDSNTVSTESSSSFLESENVIIYSADRDPSPSHAATKEPCEPPMPMDSQNHKIKKPTHPRSSMVDHSENGSGGEVVDRPEDRGGPMAAEEGDHTATEATGDASAVAAGGGDDDQGCEQEAGGGDEDRAREADPLARVETGAVDPIAQSTDSGMAMGDLERARVGSGDGDSGEDRRATEPDARVKEQFGAVGPNVDPAGPSMAVEDLSTVGGGSGDVGGSDGTRDLEVRKGTPSPLRWYATSPCTPAQPLSRFEPKHPPRDPAKGKGVVGTREVHVEEAHIEEVQTTEATPIEIREEDIAFRPPTGATTSSRHVPITYADIAKHAPDEILARVLEINPEIGEYVLKAKEDRARAIEETEAAARAERERARREGLAADMEAEEREAEEAQGPKVSAVAEAGALKCPEFSEETYTLPRSHLVVPSGFAGYKPPQQTDYDLELVLRDPGVHIANTWAEV
ncbi:hypothetical protein RHMOL_Rhmol01G0160400 [Rhododendron molle]|uniref:Uncharacterized protein n=1 Tax=Rhododendron molle TaxID=49168 RepID=A0ACC0Q4Z9_RHOML|nr:hypothetical protein RHMOL_Rhmol01G0160400 [Rhododendron molle]